MPMSEVKTSLSSAIARSAVTARRVAADGLRQCRVGERVEAVEAERGEHRRLLLVVGADVPVDESVLGHALGPPGHLTSRVPDPPVADRSPSVAGPERFTGRRLGAAGFPRR
jgi:hypothetical protein